MAVVDRLGIWFWNISASETRHRFRLRFGIRGHRRRRRCVRFGARLTESVPKFGPATCRMILPIMLLVIVAAIVRCWPGASMRTFRRVPFVAGTALHHIACENGCVGLAVRTQRPTAAAGIHHLRACARQREDKWRSASHVWNTALVRHRQYQTHCLEHAHGRAWSSRAVSPGFSPMSLWDTLVTIMSLIYLPLQGPDGNDAAHAHMWAVTGYLQSVSAPVGRREIGNATN